MTRTGPLFGVETEYALTALDRRGQPVERAALLAEMLELARRRLVHLPDHHGGLFLPGGRLYVDGGDHLELSTAECTDPDEAVRYVRAGDRIVHDLAAAVLERRPELAEAIVLRTNVDNVSHTTWSSHESYHYRRHGHAMAAQLVPHLVSRIIYTGAGGFNGLNDGAVEFTLSPRVWHLEHEASVGSTGARGIFHLKDEPLAGAGHHRLHLLCGESLGSDTALWLRLGVTALVVALIDAGARPGEAVRLNEPLAAMRRFAADPSGRAAAEDLGGRPRTALEIQRHYLEQVRRHLGGAAMPAWAAPVCERWSAILDRLEGGADAVADVLDWATRLKLFRAHVARRGADWGPLGPGRGAAQGVRAAPPPLRAELFELDLRFGQLGEGGLFAALERGGGLAPRRAREDEIEAAVARPPSAGRARLRGLEIQRLHARGAPGYACDWLAIWSVGGRRALDLSDPFAARAGWTWGPAPEADGYRRDAAIELHRRAMTEYDAARYDQALALFVAAIGAARASGEAATLALSRFWAATLLHNTGRLREAAALLETLARSRPGEVLLYMASTRRAIIAVEMPLSRRQCERALAAAECALGDRCDELRSRPLLARARLLEARGCYEEALRAAREALRRARHEPHSLAIPTHMRSVLLLCLRTGRLAAAAAYLRHWAGWDTAYPRSTEILLACGRSELARAGGRAAEALEWAERAVALPEAQADRALRAMASQVAIRARLCSGDLDGARAALRRLRRLRHAEAGADRYAVALLSADYRLARAQHAAGLPIADPVRGVEFAVPKPSRLARAATARWLCAAQRAYQRAAAEGGRIDALLDCDARATEIGGRLALLDATRRRTRP